MSEDADRVMSELAEARRSIDNFDAALIHLLAERFMITARIGQMKAASGLPAADPAREAEHTARLREIAEKSGLDPDFAERFFRLVADEVVSRHRAAAGDRNG